MLFTVHFTTKQIVSKYDQRGKKISEYTINYEQTVHGLPHVTAMRYADRDNFRIEGYEMDQTPVHRNPHERKTFVLPDTKTHKKAPKVNPNTKLHEAAATGDLAAAVNGA